MRKLPLIAVPLVLASIALSFFLVSCRQEPRPYNVILFSLDTLRADRLGAYGFKDWKISPSFDRLASDSILFENAFSTASVTTASHMSMFTGLQPIEHRLSDIISKSPRAEVLPPSLHPKIMTLPQILRDAGYHTARFVYGRDYFLDPSIGFGRGYDEIFPYGMDSLTSADAISDWLKKNKNQRFFAFIHSKRPHSPFLFSDEAIEKAERGGQLDKNYRGPIIASQKKWSELVNDKDWSGNFIPGIVPDCFYFESRVRRGKPEDQRRISQLYNLAVNETDRLLGRVLGSLEKEGLLDRTVIVLVSDHGEQFLEHGTLSHIQLHKEETHIPFLLRLPLSLRGSVKKNRISSDVQTTDILPTILAQLGLRPLPGISGKDLSPLFRGESDKIHEEVFSFNTFSMIARSSAVRTPGHTLILGESGPAFYDRKADPEERNNIAGTNSAELEKLRERLKLFELRSYSFDPESL